MAKSGGRGRADAGDPTCRLAVIDMGSTSFHLLVADVARDGRIEPVARERCMLHLGAALGADQQIPEEVCEEAVSLVRMFREVALREGATQLIPVATAALRDAQNGEQLRQDLSVAIGEPVRLLRGEEEARTIFRASFQRLPQAMFGGKAQTPRLALDLGGGSLELALGHHGQVLWECTLPLGTTRLRREFVRHDPMTKAERRAIRDRVRDALDGAGRPDASSTVSRGVAMGGTARALGKLAAARAGIGKAEGINGLFIEQGELKAMRRSLVRADLDERIAMPGLARRRADLAPTGAVILEALVRAWDLEGLVVCDWGVREGTLLEEVGLSFWG